MVQGQITPLHLWSSAPSRSPTAIVEAPAALAPREVIGTTLAHQLPTLRPCSRGQQSSPRWPKTISTSRLELRRLTRDDAGRAHHGGQLRLLKSERRGALSCCHCPQLGSVPSVSLRVPSVRLNCACACRPADVDTASPCAAGLFAMGDASLGLLDKAHSDPAWRLAFPLQFFYGHAQISVGARSHTGRDAEASPHSPHGTRGTHVSDISGGNRIPHVPLRYQTSSMQP